MPPIVILCLQLIIGTVCDASPYILPATSGHSGLLSSSSSSLASSSSGHRTSNIGTSKRQPTTLIESGDGFADRQHHEPPGQKQHQPPDEGYLYGQHHFRQPPAHPPGHHHLPPSYHHGFGVEDFMSEMPAESQDYDQQQRADEFDLAFPEVPPSASAEMENEIHFSPLFAALSSAAAESRKPSSSSSSPSMAGNNNNNHNSGGGGESFDLIRESLERIKEEEDIDIKSGLLMRLLEQMPEGPLPVVYIEDSAGKGAEEDGTESDTGSVVEGEDQLTTGNGNKRSGRYYRRYPWKRQNSRSRTYDADARYLCVPSRDDIFKLLVGLHENRTGNHQRTINFCNRKRPAKAIFTNIRFLG